MTDIWTRLKGEEKPILLYGTGNGADKILNELERLGIKVSGVFASSGFVRERVFRGFKVLSFEQAKEKFGDFVALFCFGSNRPEVTENIKNIMKSTTLLAPEVPVSNGEIFNLEYAKKHAKELNLAYSLLCDEQSRKVFEQTVLFKLDGDINRLFDCETNEDEAFENILKLKEGDSFLDLGAYNGDTVLDFVNRVGRFSNITAVEPDPKSFNKLLKNTKELNIKLINAAVSNEIGSLPFSFKGSRGTVLGGEDFTDAVNIDFLAKNTRFDYIKFDVEGNEYNAILGGENTIKRDKPKMLISAYHKSEDYFAIPLLVHKLNPDYKIYMRHYRYVPAWDTNFYFV
ncbi:MAG: FkbM family methyltransferase [Ruminococcaceae bacterium]|nr:FkbM family methyltransferase [Oscillospiraceae bacterium]